ncbi:MAG: DUF4440 domain-containing protein [Aeromonas sp.]
MNAALETEIASLWSAEEGYWNRVRSMDFAGLTNILHADFIGWPNNQPAPMNAAALINWYKQFPQILRADSITYTLTRHAASIIGAIGIVQCEIDVRASLKNGAPFVVVERITHTWVQAEGVWVLVGGMAAPVAPK